MRIAPFVPFAVAVLALAGCGSSSNEGSSSSTTTPAPAVTSTTAASLASTSSTTVVPGSPASKCENVAITPAMKTAILAADRGGRAPNASVGSPSFAGKCGNVTYAIVSLAAPGKATESFQDGPDVFTGSANGSWTYVSDTGGACPTSSIPSDLLKLWGTCNGDQLTGF